MDQPRRMRPHVIRPTPEEDAEITAAALSDPDAQPLTDEELAQFRPVWDFPEQVAFLQKHGYLGRPPLPEAERKRRVTMYLDPDVLDRLKAGGKGWQTRANAALRGALGLAEK